MKQNPACTQGPCRISPKFLVKEHIQLWKQCQVRRGRSSGQQTKHSRNEQELSQQCPPGDHGPAKTTHKELSSRSLTRALLCNSSEHDWEQVMDACLRLATFSKMASETLCFKDPLRVLQDL